MQKCNYFLSVKREKVNVKCKEEVLGVGSAVAQGKCTRLCALIVGRNAKFLSSPLRGSPCIAGSAFRSIEDPGFRGVSGA